MALGELQAADAIQYLISALSDESSFVRAGAVEALGKLKAKRAIPDLTNRLKDDSRDVRAKSAEALGELQAYEAIKDLRNALKYFSSDIITKQSGVEITTKLKDSEVTAKSAEALGKLKAKEAIEDLMEVLKESKDLFVCEKVSEAILNITKRLIDEQLKDEKDTSLFAIIKEGFEQYKEKISEKIREDISRNLNHLQMIKNQRQSSYSELVFKYPYTAGIVGFLTGLFLGWLTLLFVFPFYLLKIYEFLPLTAETKFSGWLGVITIPLQAIITLCVFRPRVLDAWVKNHLPKTSEKFKEKQTVKDRKVHVPVGLTVNNEFIPNFGVENLKNEIVKITKLDY